MFRMEMRHRNFLFSAFFPGILIFIIINLAFTVIIQFQLERNLFSQIIFRKRMTERYSILNRSSGNTPDHPHPSIIPETDIRHIILIVEIGSIRILQLTLIYKRMVLLGSFYFMLTDRNLYFEYTFLITGNYLPVTLRCDFTVNIEHHAFYRNRTVIIINNTGQIKRRLIGKVDIEHR